VVPSVTVVEKLFTLSLILVLLLPLIQHSHLLMFLLLPVVAVEVLVVEEREAIEQYLDIP
jgi:hypothetical protein